MRHLKEAKKNHSSESNQKRRNKFEKPFSLERRATQKIYKAWKAAFLINDSDYDTEDIWCMYFRENKWMLA